MLCLALTGCFPVIPHCPWMSLPPLLAVVWMLRISTLATGSLRLFPCVRFLLLLLFQQCLRAVTVLPCMTSWETLVLALLSNFHQARELLPSVFPGFLVPFLLLPNCDCPSLLPPPQCFCSGLKDILLP